MNTAKILLFAVGLLLTACAPALASTQQVEGQVAYACPSLPAHLQSLGSSKHTLEKLNGAAYYPVSTAGVPLVYILLPLPMTSDWDDRQGLVIGCADSPTGSTLTITRRGGQSFDRPVVDELLKRLQ